MEAARQRAAREDESDAVRSPQRLRLGPPHLVVSRVQTAEAPAAAAPAVMQPSTPTMLLEPAPPVAKQPSAPAVPVEPLRAEPVEPAEPAEPAEPVEPAEPAEPVEPVEEEPLTDSEAASQASGTASPQTCMGDDPDYSPTVCPTEVPDADGEELLFNNDLEAATQEAQRTYGETQKRLAELRARLGLECDQMPTAGGEADARAELTSQLKTMAAAEAAAALRMNYANLLTRCPASWRASVAHHTVEDTIFKFGVSRKAETKPKRVLARLADIIRVFNNMSSEDWLAKVVEAGRLDFDPEWLPRGWFVRRAGGDVGKLEFLDYVCPLRPQLIGIEINVDYAASAEVIKVCMPSGADRRAAWKSSIQWLREVMNNSKMAALSRVRQLQVPTDFPADYKHHTGAPCVVWIGEAPVKKGPCYGHSQPASNRATPYARPTSYSHHDAGYASWWQTSYGQGSWIDGHGYWWGHRPQ